MPPEGAGVTSANTAPLMDVTATAKARLPRPGEPARLPELPFVIITEANHRLPEKPLRGHGKRLAARRTIGAA